MSITFSLVDTGKEQFVTVFVPGRDPLPAANDHPNFKQIVAACAASVAAPGSVNADEVIDLFDVAQTVSRKFERLSERISVEGQQILLDGDPVDGSLQQQILDFMEVGADFGPLVNFYEKLLTNPLGNVRDGLYSWLEGQRANGAVTITPEGDLLGYKAVGTAQPKWREGEGDVFVPSRPSRNGDRVNGVEVPSGSYIEQRPGDVVEMPRSKVLNAPSALCGDGLHVGTFEYASTFRAGPVGNGQTVMLVKFSPRDIVSLPDSNSAWKLRVCRYEVVKAVTESLDTPLYDTVKQEAVSGVNEPINEAGKIDLGLPSEDNGPLVHGDHVSNGTTEGYIHVYDDGSMGVMDRPTRKGSGFQNGAQQRDSAGRSGRGFRRTHGKGGATSQAAKGNGRHPAQDQSGRFVAGRPGSRRDGSTGRFA